MSTTPLSLALLQKAQAEAEGFANGPSPALNNANLYTQAKEGNPQLTPPAATPVPYYPSAETPNLQLSTEDMSSQLANNFVIIDAASTFEISSRLQQLNVTVPLSISLVSPTTQMYSVSLYMSAPGTGAAGHAVFVTISYVCELGPETITITLPLDARGIIMETYPLLVMAGATVTLTTAYTGGATNDPYNITARLVQMP